MRKFLLTAILLFLGIRYGLKYITSEDFQKYGDREKAQWTCRVNNALGGLYQIGSEYRLAHDLFNRVLTRCPNSPMAEEALFQKASCLENMNDPQQALAVYQEYRETFPNGDKVITATNASERIKFGR